MTAESLKSFISSPSHGSQCSNNRYSNGNKIRFVILAVFVVLFCCAILGLVIWNTIRTTKIAQEMDQLRNAFDVIKLRFGFDSMEDLEYFENSYDHTAVSDDGETEPNGNKSFGPFIDTQDDDEFNYDDELEGSTDFEKEDDYENDGNMYEDNLPRNVRSLESSYGLPIVSESYALKRNLSNPAVDDEISRLLLDKKKSPTMQHDWDDRRAPSHHQSSFPKKYQEHRSPPTEYVQRRGRTLNENNSHKYANQHSNPQGNSQDIDLKPVHNSRGRSAHQHRLKNIAIHYGGDTSKYMQGHHANYDGKSENGRLHPVDGIYSDWEASPWVNIMNMERFFKLDQGTVTIQENGLYYIYAQIFYHDDHDMNGFTVNHNSEAFLQCTSMAQSTQRLTKSNTCFTAGVVYMRNGDTVHLKDLGHSRYTLFEPARSFFGLIKMGDARPLHETLA